MILWYWHDLQFIIYSLSIVLNMSHANLEKNDLRHIDLVSTCRNIIRFCFESGQWLFKNNSTSYLYWIKEQQVDGHIRS